MILASLALALLAQAASGVTDLPRAPLGAWSGWDANARPAAPLEELYARATRAYAAHDCSLRHAAHILAVRRVAGADFARGFYA